MVIVYSMMSRGHANQRVAGKFGFVCPGLL